MPSVENKDKLETISEILKKKPNFVVTTYTGLDVEKITKLRGQIRQVDGTMKVLKNTLFHRALTQSDAHKEAAEGLKTVLKGPCAVIFVGEDVPSVAKLIVTEGKTEEKLALKGGYFEGRFIPKNEMQAIAELPSRDDLLAIIGRGLNTPATKIATGINQIMAGLARGIKAVAEKNNR
jgi:large subunit ribosomal protein L10